MGTRTDYANLYVPALDEAGPSWGNKVSENFVTIDEALKENADASVANLGTATGRAAALSLVFGA